MWGTDGLRFKRREHKVWAVQVKDAVQRRFFTQITENFASGSRSYIKEDLAVLSYNGQANSGLAARAAPPNWQMKATWPRPPPELPARKISNAGRNKSELSRRPLRGKQVFCEVRFQSLIYSHNKGGIM